MRYVSINNVKQGEQLGKHIFANDGRILLNEGVTLTLGLISKLRFMGVTSIFVKDEQFDDIEVEEVVSEATKRRAITKLADSVRYIQKDRKLDSQNISDIVNKMIEETMDNSEVLFHLTDIRTKDNELFIHSVNVCILSVMVGVQLELDKSKIKELAMGALFHDIGKLVGKLDPRDLPKGYKDQEEFMDHHAWKGFNFLRKIPEISTLSAHIALTHHENVDGSGDPRGLEEKDIHYLAKIVAVANDYDRFISSSEEGMGLVPSEACERILGLTNIRYDHNVVWKFLRCVAFYPTGSQVKLSNGLNGVVVGQNSGLPQRPIIRSYDMDDTNVPFEEIDLAKETTIFIEDLHN